MNYAGRAMLSAIAALTMLGAGSGAALADDKHGPDDSHGHDGTTPPAGDGVCSTITSPITDPILDIPVIEPDPNDPDCMIEPGTQPDDEDDVIDACGTDPEAECANPREN